MIWIISAILTVVAFVMGFVLAPKTIKVEVSSLPKMDERKPLRAHNPDTESFGQAQSREYD